MSGARIEFSGLDGFARAFAGVNTRVDGATRRAVAGGLLAINKQAAINSTGRPGPNVVTGAHRRSFKVAGPVRSGSFGWAGTCGPTMVYSRRLDRGGGNWPAGVAFPYWDSAVQMAKSIAIPVLFKRYWSEAVSR